MDEALIDQGTFDAIIAIPDDQILKDYWPQISEVIGNAGLDGERPDEAIRRFYEAIFKPKVALLAHRNHKAALRLRKVLTENALDISLVSVGLVANCIIDIQDVHEKPEQKALAGFSLLIIKFALKRPKSDGKS